MIAHSLVLSTHRGFFCPISFHHALEIYWLHHKGIVSIQAFTKICLMSDHIFPYEWSKILLWSFTVLFWVLTQGFFCPISFITPWKSIFPISSVIFMLKKTIIGYLNFFLMSAHKMRPLTTYNLDMFIPTSWGNIVPVCNEGVASVDAYITSSVSCSSAFMRHS